MRPSFEASASSKWVPKGEAEADQSQPKGRRRYDADYDSGKGNRPHRKGNAKGDKGRGKGRKGGAQSHIPLPPASGEHVHPLRVLLAARAVVQRDATPPAVRFSVKQVNVAGSGPNLPAERTPGTEKMRNNAKALHLDNLVEGSAPLSSTPQSQQHALLTSLYSPSSPFAGTLNSPVPVVPPQPATPGPKAPPKVSTPASPAKDTAAWPGRHSAKAAEAVPPMHSPAALQQLQLESVAAQLQAIQVAKLQAQTLATQYPHMQQTLLALHQQQLAVLARAQMLNTPQSSPQKATTKGEKGYGRGEKGSNKGGKAKTVVDKDVIKTTVSYYFSEENLYKDEYLRTLMDAETGWVQLASIAQFRKMKVSGGTPAKIAELFASSEQLEVSSDGTRIRVRDEAMRKKFLLPSPSEPTADAAPSKPDDGGLLQHIRTAVSAAGISAEAIFASVAGDDPEINSDQFRKILREFERKAGWDMASPVQEDALWKMLDKNGDGSCDLAEFLELFGADKVQPAVNGSPTDNSAATKEAETPASAEPTAGDSEAPAAQQDAPEAAAKEGNDGCVVM
mmetsp:Transcript_8157/g.17772  ORF Transcript_8157/g.17772 Transcript_8157/m.17772 type:complete len:564 (-) Transcript_8157:208-1899(-)